ncbi:metalloregulator ArsR/SmtB family transcription factor [Leucobacter sp. M11]|nr:metalloregulator ArsR/SmtB family transcription factor [Leucobacter sp. M11]MEB4613481.1 metalloregulator ArsR/SmtB family transcription factor [Leucobacter sp. M11]
MNAISTPCGDQRAAPGGAPPAAPAADAHCSPRGRGDGLGAEAALALATRVKALADPSRLRLLSLIAATPESETCVCDLTEPLGLGQPTVSHHLRVLQDAGFLRREKRGVWAYYSLVPGALDDLVETLRPLASRAP